MSHHRKTPEPAAFDREEFIGRMIPILRARNMDIGPKQLVELMSFPELCELAWIKLIRRPENLDNGILCQVIKNYPQHRVEAAALVLLREPTIEHLCCINTFVPQYRSVCSAMLAKHGYQLP
jgi:hypothetical protein